METPDAVLTAVLRTLLRATADARQPVVLRTRRSGQAEALARWLAEAHGSNRTVIASVTQRAPVEVRLPRRMAWPACTGPGGALAPDAAGHHLSSMRVHDEPHAGNR